MDTSYAKWDNSEYVNVSMERENKAQSKGTVDEIVGRERLSEKSMDARESVQGNKV